MKNLHKIMFVLGLCIILTGCSDSDSKIKNIDNLEEHGFVYEGEMMCQANDLETKINKKIKLTITTPDGKKNQKKNIQLVKFINLNMKTK